MFERPVNDLGWNLKGRTGYHVWTLSAVFLQTRQVQGLQQDPSAHLYLTVSKYLSSDDMSPTNHLLLEIFIAFHLLKLTRTAFAGSRGPHIYFI